MVSHYRVWRPNISITIEFCNTRVYWTSALYYDEQNLQLSRNKIILRQMLCVLMFYWNFHPIIAHRIVSECGASLTRHISTQNEAQSMVGGNSIVLQYFIVINQHMGLHRNLEFTIQALKTPKMNFTGIHYRAW